MKTLVAFYSRTGNTRRVGLELAKLLKADVEEIIDLKDRSGMIGWLKAGKHAAKKSPTTIKKIEKNPNEYDLVVIGTPIWAWTVTPAVRMYLSQIDKDKLKHIAFFCTCGGSQSKCFSEMQKLSKEPLATLEINSKDLKTNQHIVKTKEFCEKIQKPSPILN